MQTLIDGINLVQIGFLTNTESLIKEGVFEIKSSTDVLTQSEHSGMPSFEKIQELSYTKKNVAQLNAHADELLKQFQDGNVKIALKEYNSIMLQCIECHSKLRNEEDRTQGFR